MGNLERPYSSARNYRHTLHALIYLECLLCGKSSGADPIVAPERLFSMHLSLEGEISNSASQRLQRLGSGLAGAVIAVYYLTKVDLDAEPIVLLLLRPGARVPAHLNRA